MFQNYRTLKRLNKKVTLEISTCENQREVILNFNRDYV